MSFHLSPQDWQAAEAALQGKPSGTKYDKYPLLNSGEKDKNHQRSPNSFVIVENVIYAIANRNENDHEEGGSSIVKKGLTKDGKLVAIRIRSSGLEEMQSEAMMASIQNKLFIGQGVRNSQSMTINLKLSKPIKTQQKLYTVMEWRGDSLNGLFIKFTKFTNTQKQLMGLYACLLVDDLHNDRVVHGDLKAENITIEINGNYMVLRPVDFEFSRTLAEGLQGYTSNRLRGTPVFMSLENIIEQHYSFLSDTYALAIMLLFQIDVACKEIDKYFDEYEDEWFKDINVITGKGTYLEAMSWLRSQNKLRGMDKNLETILDKMLTSKIEDRIDAKQMILYLCEQLMADKTLEADIKQEVSKTYFKYTMLKVSFVLSNLATTTASPIELDTQIPTLTTNFKRAASDEKVVAKPEFSQQDEKHVKNRQF